jgi:large subunit ribosomal protein L6
MSLIKIDLKNYIKQLKLFKINNFKFLVLMNNLNKLLYFQIENNYAILKKKELLYFKILKKNKRSLVCFTKFNLFISNLEIKYKKKLFLKGLGLRITLFENNECHILKLKLGRSYIVDVPFEKNKINIYIKKKFIYLKSYDLAFLGNYAKKIKELKIPNSYTGKGFWYSNEKKNYKIFKKK